MVGNARENMVQISLGIKAIEFGGRDQRVDRGASLTTAVRAEVQEVFTAERQFPFILARYGQNERELALGRRNYLFAGSDGGGESAAIIYSLIGTARLNDVEPFAYLRAVFERIADHPINRVDELLPWRLMPVEQATQLAA
jgi:hypothetical protein